MCLLLCVCILPAHVFACVTSLFLWPKQSYVWSAWHPISQYLFKCTTFSADILIYNVGFLNEVTLLLWDRNAVACGECPQVVRSTALPVALGHVCDPQVQTSPQNPVWALSQLPLHLWSYQTLRGYQKCDKSSREGEWPPYCCMNGFNLTLDEHYGTVLICWKWNKGQWHWEELVKHVSVFMKRSDVQEPVR